MPRVCSFFCRVLPGVFDLYQYVESNLFDLILILQILTTDLEIAVLGGNRLGSSVIRFFLFFFGALLVAFFRVLAQAARLQPRPRVRPFLVVLGRFERACGGVSFEFGPPSRH